MSQSAENLAESIDDASRQGTLFETFATSLAGPVFELAQSVQQNPTLENVRDWLAVFAGLSALSIEGPAETTLALLKEDRTQFETAEKTLAPEDQNVIAAFVASLDAKDLTLDDLAAESAAIAEHPHIEEAPGAPVPATLGQFVISQSFDGSRVRLYQGTFSVTDRTGAPLGIFQARTGGFVADFKTRNGPTPPGLYKIVTTLPGIAGMTLNDVTFCFLLAPVGRTDVFGRSGLCIHPDGPPPGTHGCIGINEDAGNLRRCSQAVSGLMNNGPVGISVEYVSSTPVA
jgi:hypothetical protein